MIAQVCQRISPKRSSNVDRPARLVTILVVVITLAVLPTISHAQNIPYSAGGPEMANDHSDEADNAVVPFCMLPKVASTPPGLRVEMSLAPPTNIPTDPYELGKYGRIAVEYTRIAMLDGTHVGMQAQALHVAHHLLFYSFGLTSDINNDGMFLLTAGVAHYQTGNNRAEPFVDAPFIRVRFQSSPDDIFLYSELETTMHFREYLSGMAGIGIRLSPAMRLMGGFHHTEFVMPTEQLVRQVEGLEGIISWGM